MLTVKDKKSTEEKMARLLVEKEMRLKGRVINLKEARAVIRDFGVWEKTPDRKHALTILYTGFG